MKSFFLKNEGQRIFTIEHEAENSQSAVIMLHGFTGNHIENRFIFAHLSKTLERAGLSSIRFDFRGSGDSDGEFVDMTLSSEISDALTVVNYAKEKYSKIGILGLSMGGTVALFVAPQVKPAALCLWAPAAKNAEVFTKGGMPPHANAPLDIGGLAISPKFIEEIVNTNAFEKAKHYEGPTLIVHGTEDPTVPFSHSEDLEKEFKNAELLPIKGANHTFTSLQWSNVVIRNTTDFFKENL